VPEGYEDIDVRLDGRRIFVQVKQRSGRLTLTQLSDALARSAGLLDPRPGEALRLAVVTDAPDLDGVEPTGWSKTLENDDRLARTLANKVGPGLALRVAASSHLVQLRPDLTSIADALSKGRKVGVTLTSHLAAAQLLARVQERAAANRTASSSTDLVLIRRDEVDELLHHAAAQEGSLLEIERTGAITPTRFRRPPQATRAEFLRGLRARPWHIAAGYAVERRDAFARLEEAVESSNAAILLGPSGSGKSTLMWQYAYETSGRCFTLNRIVLAEVDMLGLFIDLMTPDGAAPLVLCADDIGRADMEGWTDLIGRYAGDRRLVLLGTCREESFTMKLSGSGTAKVVTPVLSEAEAERLGEELPVPANSRRTRDDFRRLRIDANGLMMEFVHLATTNRHLAETLEEQVAQLFEADDATALEVLRFVAAADVGGAALQPTHLRATGATDAEIGRAIRRLDSEFLSRTEDDAIAGLHPLRSRYLLDSLHREVPTVAETFARLIAVVDRRALEGIVVSAFRISRDPAVLEEAVAQRLSADTEAATDFLFTLLRAEAACFAQRLDNELGPDEAGELILLGKLAGRMEAVRSTLGPLQDVSLASPLMKEALKRAKYLNERLAATSDPRPVRRNIFALLDPDTVLLMVDPALNAPQGLSPLFGSDALDTDAASDVFTRLGDRLADDDLAEAVGRLAAVGPRAVAAVAQVLGPPLERIEWVLDRLIPVLSLKSDGGVTAEVLAPAAGPSQTLRERTQHCAALAHTVAPEVERLSLNIQHSEGGRLRLLGETEFDIVSYGDSKWLAEPALEVFEEEYRHKAELTWSQWLLAAAEVIDETAVDLEMVTASVIGARHRPQEARRWAAKARAATASRPKMIPSPPRITAEDPRQLLHLFAVVHALKTPGDLLQQTLESTLDPDKVRDSCFAFEASRQLIRPVRDWLNRFAAVSAVPALDRLLLAADAASWLLHAVLGDAELEGILTKNVSPKATDPGRTVSMLMQRASEFSAALLKRERLLLQPILDAGWELHEMEATHRSGVPPVRRWLILARNELGVVDTQTANRLLAEAETPTLHGRVLAGHVLPGGPLASRLLVWFGPGDWRAASTLDNPAAENAVPYGGDRGPTLMRVIDVLSALEALSRRATAARLRGEQALGPQRLSRVDQAIAQLPPSVLLTIEPIRAHVESELRGGDDAISLAVEQDRHRDSETYQTKMTSLVIAAHVAAAEVDARARAPSR
jgi:hypothetical protein